MDRWDHMLIWHLMVLLFALAAALIIKMMTGAIITHGLLTDPVTHRVSPLRVQNLLAMLTVATVYITKLANNPGAEFPKLDNSMLALIAGSNAGILLPQVPWQRLWRR